MFHLNEGILILCLTEHQGASIAKTVLSVFLDRRDIQDNSVFICPGIKRGRIKDRIGRLYITNLELGP